MAKRRNVSGRVLRNAVPQPRDVAEFIAPRTVNEGLSVKNVFGDVGDMIDPFITAAIEKQEGLRDVSDDELKMLAALGSIPVAGAVAGKLTKKLNKLVPNPKGGFIRVKQGDKVKDILQKVSDAGQPLSQAQEAKLREAIGNYNAIMRGDRNAARKLIKFQGEAERDPALKQAYVGFLESKGDNTLGGIIMPDVAGHRGVTKPANFDSWTPDERINYIQGRVEFHGGSLDDLSEPLYKEHPEYGVLTDKGLRIEDYHKALLDKKVEEARAAEAARPITATQVQELSTGIVPGQARVPQGGTRPSYDHSRQFMDTELKQVPGIDRTGMSYGDDTDAFYDIYKAWRDNPGKEEKALRKVVKEAKSKDNINTMLQTDPYYAAGVVGDKNNRLWERINKLREEGKTDAEIRSLLKDDLDKYQGYLERFKSRMPSKNKAAQFKYDGAATNVFKALPSEEARALKALGVDTPEYDQLERLGNFYRVFFPK
jgi:hypothetical protein